MRPTQSDLDRLFQPPRPKESTSLLKIIIFFILIICIGFSIDIIFFNGGYEQKINPEKAVYQSHPADVISTSRIVIAPVPDSMPIVQPEILTHPILPPRPVLLPDGFRIWTNPAGKTVTAKLIDFSPVDYTIKLKMMASGKTVIASLDKFGEVDHEFLHDQGDYTVQERQQFVRLRGRIIKVMKDDIKIQIEPEKLISPVIPGTERNTRLHPPTKTDPYIAPRKIDPYADPERPSFYISGIYILTGYSGPLAIGGMVDVDAFPEGKNSDDGLKLFRMVKH